MRDVSVRAMIVAALLFPAACGDNNGLMKPGQNCMRCHDGGGPPAWTIAGTVYSCGDASSSAGVEGATIVITDASGNEVTRLTSNAAGNFYTDIPFAGEIQARVFLNGVSRWMTLGQSSGACNSCHAVPGQNGAPGRIYADSALCSVTGDVPPSGLGDPGPSGFVCPTAACATGSGLLMQPGRDCGSCHASPARFAGTVYGPDGETCGSANQGVSGVTVSAVPADGSAAIVLGTTNCVGTFTYQGATDFGGKDYNFQVSLDAGGKTLTKTMLTVQTLDATSGVACGRCHSSAGIANAPIHL